MAESDVLNVSFHGIGAPGRELEPGEDAYWVDTERFLRILDELATWPSVRLSFDDGNASDLRIAAPALAERGLAAQFFPLAGRLGVPGSLDSDDVRELASRGMTIGSHGMGHRSWRGMDPETQRSELIEARQRLAEAAGVAITEAACPLGRYDRRLLSDLRKLGYQRVYTSDRRVDSKDGWLQPRFSVYCHDTPGSLRAAALGKASSKVSRLRLAAIGLVKRLRLALLGQNRAQPFSPGRCADRVARAADEG